jgi:hypothetical protein
MGPLGARALLVALFLPLAAGCRQTDTQSQRTFATPEAAAQALLDTLERDDVDALLGLFGREYADEIVSADWDAERDIRQRIASAARETYELREIDEGEVQLVIGAEGWPFPFPIVRQEDVWRFDSEEGIEELVDRRIGRNELTAIAIARAYLDAQIEYAQADRDGDDVLEYAQRLASSPGKRDGLYWEAESDEELSPFGPLVLGAERYLETRQPGDPIRGYYFQVLTRQGENPPGGRYDYVINGKLIRGFALVAYPADYGDSGVMTFVVNHRRKIHQKDLGEFAGMDEYDPDDTWTDVKD